MKFCVAGVCYGFRWLLEVNGGRVHDALSAVLQADWLTYAIVIILIDVINPKPALDKCNGLQVGRWQPVLSTVGLLRIIRLLESLFVKANSSDSLIMAQLSVDFQGFGTHVSSAP